MTAKQAALFGKGLILGELRTVLLWKRLLILEWKRIQLQIGSAVPGLRY